MSDPTAPSSLPPEPNPAPAAPPIPPQPSASSTPAADSAVTPAGTGLAPNVAAALASCSRKGRLRRLDDGRGFDRQSLDQVLSRHAGDVDHLQRGLATKPRHLTLRVLPCRLGERGDALGAIHFAVEMSADFSQAEH